MKNLVSTFLCILVIALTLCSCKDKELVVTPDPVVPKALFSTSPDSLKFTESAGSDTLKINMNGSNWTVLSNQTWCTLSFNSSSKASDKLIVSTSTNTVAGPRTATLTFIMDQKTIVYFKVIQTAKTGLYPSYKDSIAADITGMNSDAKTLASKMSVGWNVGNSLEAAGGETAWGNPQITQLLIDSIKAAGINAIRIPCNWNSYVEDASTSKISATWFARVKEVVDYCFKNNMYVILNIHWDGGWLDATSAKQVAVNAKQKALWEQIAKYFRGYDEHLLFAGSNEPSSTSGVSNENYAIQLSYNQTFVDAVRSTGGKNTYRNLIVQAFETNIDKAVSNLVVSKDKVANRLFVEVHYYDPWDYCGLETDATWASAKYYWGAPYAQYGLVNGQIDNMTGRVSNWGQEDYVRAQFQKMKTNFVDKGYPVILGEFGAMRRSSLTGSALTNHLASRAYYMQYIAQYAKQYGMVPFIWDNGATGDKGFGIFNRSNGSVFDRQTLNAYITGAVNGKYPF